jgi:hypothetical protein
MEMTLKRTVVLMLALGLVIGGVTATEAAKKSGTVKLFFHGTEAVGEVDLVNNFAVGYNQMDTKKPDGSAPKSVNGIFWVGDPALWNDCAGMFGLPVWIGQVSGKVVGDIKLTLHTLSLPRELEIEFWPDVASMQCKTNDFSEGSYPKPAVSKRVDIPAGHTANKIVFKGVNFKAQSNILVQFTSVGPGGPRILYDAADYASSIEFRCVPVKGKKSCV